ALVSSECGQLDAPEEGVKANYQDEWASVVEHLVTDLGNLHSVRVPACPQATWERHKGYEEHRQRSRNEQQSGRHQPDHAHHDVRRASVCEESGTQRNENVSCE